MFKLFQSIFSSAPETAGRYPASLVTAAIERAVDGTDPRLRALPGYQKRLRAPVVHAIDHVIALVEDLPAPTGAARHDFYGDSRLTTLFASVDRMGEVFSLDRAMIDFLAGDGVGLDSAIALLMAERAEKKILGMELDGEILKREVAQTAVSFRSHRLVDPTANVDETRRLLKRRAFDHLLALALGRIAGARVERGGLEQQRSLLRRKLKRLQEGRWSFEEGAAEVPSLDALTAELEDIERQLSALGGDTGTLRVHLDLLVEVLEHAEQQLWSKPIAFCVDHMNIKHERPGETAHEVTLVELYSANGRSGVILLVRIPTRELRPPDNFLAAAQRYLG